MHLFAMKCVSKIKHKHIKWLQLGGMLLELYPHEYGTGRVKRWWWWW